MDILPADFKQKLSGNPLHNSCRKVHGFFHENLPELSDRFDFLNINDTHETVKKLNSHKSLHAMNDKKSLDYFKKNPQLTSADGDVKFHNGNLILSDKPTVVDKFIKNHLKFNDWMKEIINLDKVSTIKIDIKNQKAVEPLIRTLNAFKEKYPDKWRNKTLILNANVPIGKANKGSSVKLPDLKKLKEKFPEAITSLGLMSLPDKKSLEHALKYLGPGSKTIAVQTNTKFNRQDFDMLDKHDTFVTFWSLLAHVPQHKVIRNIALKDLKVPKGCEGKYWLEF